MTRKISESPPPIASLQNCEDEPIHIPGAIQGRGLLLGINQEGVVTHRAGDVSLMFASDPLGRSLHAASPDLFGALHDRAQGSRPMVRFAGRMFGVRAHENDQGVRVLEIEPDEPVGLCLKAALRAISEADTVTEALEAATRAGRSLTGYDRVVAYMFDPDLNGTVLAEDRREGITSFLHQRFPSSDIPPQAMRLYRRKRVRLIADVNYEPQPIWAIPGAASPLDLSDADLRSVSPIHLEYLRNMGVAGSLVCTLMAENEMLGMLACHHLAPRSITPTHRDGAGAIAIATAHRVKAIRDREQSRRRIASFREAASMLLDLTDEGASPEGLGTHVERVQRLLDAEGAAIVLGGRVFTSGCAPGVDDVLRISEALRAGAGADVQHTDHLASVDPSFEGLAGSVAGVVRCSLLGGDRDAVLWFRPEVTRSVTWAGAPAAHDADGAAGRGRLTPRASFDAFVERVTGRSVAWQPWELDAAEGVRGVVSNIAWRMRVLRDLAEKRQRINEELSVARDRALAASKAKTDFLANMSHEIRTPMTAILGFADLLAGDLDLAPGEVDGAIETIRSNADHLLSLINDILDVSKIEAGQLNLETIDTHPIQTVEEVASLVRPRAAGKGVDVRIRYDTPVPRVIRSDPTRLRQVLLNLVGNAVKFTEIGSVTVHVRCDADAQAMQFRVVDTGIGMSPEQAARVSRFDAFTQADESTTRRFGGTGLGLRISHSLALLLGGEIAMESAEGEGSTFILTVDTGTLAGHDFVLPEDAAAALETARCEDRRPDAEDAGAKPLEGVRILLAEDGLDNQRLISFHLTRAGARVEVVSDGVEAVEAALVARSHRAPFDLVIMDMQMPRLDGYGATRRLRRLGIETAILALTAHAMDGDRDRCLDAGCDDYPTKPIDRHALIAACGRRARRAARPNDAA